MKRLLATALLAITLFVAAPAGVGHAFQIIPNADCNGQAASSAVCQEKNTTTNPLTGPNGLILKIANIVAVVAGTAAVIIIVLAGLRLIQSGGNTEDVVGARRALIYAVIGLIVILIARVLIGLVLSAL